MGLLFAFGFLIEILLLSLIGGFVFWVASRFRFGRVTKSLVTLGTLGIVLIAPNVKEMYRVHIYNKICRVEAGRHIEVVIRDVEGIRVEGNFDSIERLSIIENYQYNEWTAPSGLKWRSNRSSSAICGRSRGCNVRDFSARYLLLVHTENIASGIRSYEQTAIDPVSGIVLGKEKTFTIERSEVHSLQDLLLLSWKLPMEFWEKPNEECSGSSTVEFSNAVFVPKPKL